MYKARHDLRGGEGKEKAGAIASFCGLQGQSSTAQTASTRAVEGGQSGRSGVRQAEGARHGNTGRAACVPVRGGSGKSKSSGVQPLGRAVVKDTRRTRARIHDQNQEGNEERALESAEALGTRPVALAFHAFGLVEGVGRRWGERTGKRQGRPVLFFALKLVKSVGGSNKKKTGCGCR